MINDLQTQISGFAGGIDRVCTETIDLKEPFVDTAARFADLTGTVVLASGTDHDAARYHILAARPWLTYRFDGVYARLETRDDTLCVKADPLEVLRALLHTCAVGQVCPDLPLCAGLLGYLSYDLKNRIENLPRTAVDDQGLPEICLYAPSVLLICDRHRQTTRLCIPLRSKTGQTGAALARDWFFAHLYRPAQCLETGFSGGSTGFFSPFTRRTYMEAVETVKDYIVSGDIYQVNFSQRFETDFSGHPYAMFARLFADAPAPFYAYVHAGDHWIVSTSPERFVCKTGSLVETRPIKGTRPRAETAAADRALAEELQSSEKEDAELSMIVDLMRNDLGRVCAAGTVAVAEHKRLEAWPNVFHLVSVIRGRLAENKDSVDLIRAAFPGGSVTGCPRIRAMEIIDELEPACRHVYTGSIGYIGFDGQMDLSIAIRTAVIRGNRMFFSVGGGVVFDSDPASEYEETLHKGRSVMSVFGEPGRVEDRGPRIWLNGMIVAESDARVPVTDPGVQYGYGFFETIRVENNQIHLAEAHLKRFFRTWQALFNIPVPDQSWQTIVSRVVAANNLTKQVCAVKLLAAARQEENRLDRPPHLMVSAASYVHRLEQAGKPALDLATYPCFRQTPLAGHKTMNYLYYLMAGKWARRQGADEAVICNPDGSVSETNTANLLAVYGKTVICPSSAHVLTGVMEQAVTRRLQALGFFIRRKPVTVQSLVDADLVMVTNSLMGPVGVRSVDGRAVACDPEWVAGLRSSVLSDFS
ncbi:MAG: aminodeoxychorismate synthase component I [Desulfosalsimonas sp.]|uniref:aminodeoxychorismate synthase component I n=1 Tax=Desulfosalsimonas sp. TaxID=3073848 RepID=UPI003970DE7F